MNEAQNVGDNSLSRILLYEYKVIINEIVNKKKIIE